MSSWRATGGPQAPIRLGYKQLRPEGTFVEKDRPATVVSAYYPMKAKASVESYKIWIQRFLTLLQGPLVFFTDETMVDFVTQHRAASKDKTKIIVLPREEWVASTNFSEDFWISQHRLDPEQTMHSPELYKVWYEKIHFVKRAIELNPFQTTDFVWCDAGILRHENFLPLVKEFPVASRIPTDRMLLLNTWPFTRNDEVVVTIQGEQIKGGASGKPRIGGGVLAASVSIWQEYSKMYDDMVRRFLCAGLFIGKDQTLMTTLVLEKKQFFSLVDCKQFFYDIWLFLPVWLGCSPKLYRFLLNEPWYGRKRTIDELVKMS